ncbi:hypothetical protein ABFB09_09490 [Dehalogenimonas sp. THU2]|uniref:hypothetical protein n=1 Tax=Dehalogenimonas sp. THU2 TaxID=3151121 RepID=UPI0032189CB3
MAVLAPTALASITLASCGSGYTTAPSVSFSGGGGSGASATATLSPTSLAGLNLLSGGSGYSTAPTVTISGGGGSGAAATATLTAIAPYQTLTWDVENRLVSITGNSADAQYVYDGDGKRVKEIENGKTILYINQYYEKNLGGDDIV